MSNLFAFMRMKVYNHHINQIPVNGYMKFISPQNETDMWNSIDSAMDNELLKYTATEEED